MPRSAPPSKNPVLRPEQVLTGGAIGMGIVSRVAVIHSQQASRISWHAHECFEILFLSEGATSYEFSDGETVELPGGHFLVIPPRMKHRGVLETRSPVRLCGVMFDPTLSPGRNTPFSRQELKWLACRFQEGSCTAYRMTPELRRAVRALAQTVTAGTRSACWGTASLRLQLCQTLLDAARQMESAPPELPSQLVLRATSYMESHLSEHFSMNAVAQAVRCSRAKLFHVFKEATGLTPNDYLQRLRIKHAQGALTGTDLPITQIAMRCGFSTSQYFCNVFRKYSGATPSEFRQRQT